MGYFDDWFGFDYFGDDWFDESPTGGVPTSGHPGISKSKILGTTAPRPQVPPWRQIPGPVGTAIKGVLDYLHKVNDQSHLWGNHVEVTFGAPDTPTRVDTGLGAAAQGYKVVRTDANLTVRDATAPAPSQDRGIIWLQASAAGTATLYIY